MKPFVCCKCEMPLSVGEAVFDRIYLGNGEFGNVKLCRPCHDSLSPRRKTMDTLICERCKLVTDSLQESQIRDGRRKLCPPCADAIDGSIGDYDGSCERSGPTGSTGTPGCSGFAADTGEPIGAPGRHNTFSEDYDGSCERSGPTGSTGTPGCSGFAADTGEPIGAPGRHNTFSEDSGHPALSGSRRVLRGKELRAVAVPMNIAVPAPTEEEMVEIREACKRFKSQPITALPVYVPTVTLSKETIAELAAFYLRHNGYTVTKSDTQ